MIVLDSPAFLNAVQLPAGEKATTPGVLKELKDRRSKMLADAAMASGELRILSPSPESVSRVREAAGRISRKLSPADVSVLALALQLNCPIMTDDYAVQVVSNRLGIGFKPAYHKGIKERTG